MATGVTCELFADGVRVPDGSEVPVVEGDPFALSGLALAWGRSTTVDQPEASTCSFEVADLSGARAFGDLFTVGTAIQVRATGTIYPDPTVSTFPDPGFEAAAPNTTAIVRATVARSTRRARAGTQSARILTDAAAAASVIFAPLPFVPAGTSPDAWDAIPATAVGQRWTYGAAVFAPAGATVVVRPVLFRGPYANAWTVDTTAAPLTVIGDGAWHDVAGPVIPSVAGRWLGIQVTVDPTGPAWDGLPPTLAWDAVAADWTWDDYAATFVDSVAVMAPAAGASSTVLVYAGRITDLELAYDDSIPAPVLRATCADFTADLDNIDVGDTPWVSEAMGTRFQRILALTGQPITATIDGTVSGILVSWRDVDLQPATGLLADLATSVDAVMWSAVHQVSGPYFDVEDVNQRPPGSRLVLAGGVVVIVPSITGGLDLSACDVLREPVRWSENVGDVSTRVAVTWLEQITGPPPSTAEHTYLLVDATREGTGPGLYGVRRYGVSTELQSATDAATVAQRILDRTAIGWRASGITVDALDVADADTDPTTATNQLLTLLDGTSRNGLLLRLADLPEWAPGQPVSAAYLEGGRYTFTDGRWVLDLVVSNAAHIGLSAQWDQLGVTWQWDQFDPSITWDDLRGVGV